jgi:hypothetical protein
MPTKELIHHLIESLRSVVSITPCLNYTSTEIIYVEDGRTHRFVVSAKAELVDELTSRFIHDQIERGLIVHDKALTAKFYKAHATADMTLLREVLSGHTIVGFYIKDIKRGWMFSDNTDTFISKNYVFSKSWKGWMDDMVWRRVEQPEDTCASTTKSSRTRKPTK